MRAALVERYGKHWSVSVGDRPRPSPGPNDLLVRIHASSVSRTDLGELLHPNFQKLITRSLRGRRILGMDFAGEVVEVGSAVTANRPGDRLFGFCPLRRDGAHADYAVIDAGGPFARLPDSVPFGQAVVCEGAYYASATIDKFALGPGKSVLVYGASGAIGSAAVQLARIAGAHVTAAVMPRHRDWVAALGPDEVVDATGPELAALGPGFDVVFDSVGKMTADRWRPLVRPGGHFATTDAGPGGQSLRLMLWGKLTGSDLVSVPLPPRDTARPLFKRLSQWLEDGSYRPAIDRTYALTEIAEAYRYVQTGEKSGIVALAIDLA